MLRLRDALERGCRHPVAGPLFLLLLALLLFFVAFHGVADGAVGGSFAVCMLVAFVAVVIAAHAGPIPLRSRLSPPLRAPPARQTPRLPASPFVATAAPLRL